MTQGLNLHVKGLVQGVGFRPFVYRMAKKHGVCGWVLNAIDGVHIHAEGEEAALDAFALSVADEAPAAAHVQEIDLDECAVEGFWDFEIRFSEETEVDRTTLVSPDLATCAECEQELFDPSNRRYRYPFINCTNCGPRFTIIESLPYDRAATSMRDFKMCPECAHEYSDPADRRFHAQPDACFACGPQVSLSVEKDGVFPDEDWGVSREASDDIFARVQDLFFEGKIVAVKGLGGFHLVCDADNEQAVADLRRRKHRDGKALAVMVASVDQARSLCFVSDEEAAQLESPQRPIVLLRKMTETTIGKGVADGLPELGVMLPTTPVQHILIRDFQSRGGRMLIMTSGNLHDEPIVFDDSDARKKFVGIADAVLGNNRAILSRFDDSVLRVVDAGAAGRFVQVVRRARGFAPAPIDVSGVQEDVPVVFATGPEQKCTSTLLEGKRAFVGQHIGDLEDAAAYDAWLSAKTRMERLFGLDPEIVACDMHPAYLSTQWAEGQSKPVVKVQHHHAHIVAVMAENNLEGPVCGIAFDGTGMGVDGAVWGGEVLLSNQAHFERFANFGYVPMPGGAAAVKHPLRMAYGVLWDYDLLEHEAAANAISLLGDTAPMLGRMIEQGINTPYTSSVGRLFDAASAILGVCVEPTYQGEGAILLESVISDELKDEDAAAAERYEVTVVKNTATQESTAEDTSVVLFDAKPTFAALLDDAAAGAPVGAISRRFHNAIVGAIVRAAQLVSAVYGPMPVALAGGVFMNRYIVEHAVAALFEEGFTVAVSKELPPNDGSISFGQAVVACRLKEEQN